MPVNAPSSNGHQPAKGKALVAGFGGGDGTAVESVGAGSLLTSIPVYLDK